MAEDRKCPICGNAMRRNGKTKSGTQRWRCKSCGASSASSRPKPSIAVVARKEDKPPKKSGRARKAWDDNDVRIFRELCSIFCTRKEVAAVMGVSVKTLDRLIAENLPDTPTFAEAFELYSGSGRESLRRKLYEKAMGGDRTILIFMAKNHLGMSDDGKRSQSEDPAASTRTAGLLGNSRWAGGKASNA